MRLSKLIGMLQDLQRNPAQQYGEDFDPDVDVITHVNDAVAEGAKESIRGKGHQAGTRAEHPVEIRVHFDCDDEPGVGVLEWNGTTLG